MVLLLPFLSLFLSSSFTKPDISLHTFSLPHIKNLLVAEASKDSSPTLFVFKGTKGPLLSYHLSSDFTIRATCCRLDLLPFFRLSINHDLSTIQTLCKSHNGHSPILSAEHGHEHAFESTCTSGSLSSRPRGCSTCRFLRQQHNWWQPDNWLQRNYQQLLWQH